MPADESSGHPKSATVPSFPLKGFVWTFPYEQIGMILFGQLPWSLGLPFKLCNPVSCSSASLKNVALSCHLPCWGSKTGPNSACTLQPLCACAHATWGDLFLSGLRWAHGSSGCSLFGDSKFDPSATERFPCRHTIWFTSNCSLLGSGYSGHQVRFST